MNLITYRFNELQTAKKQLYILTPTRIKLKHHMQSLYINPDMFRRTSTPFSVGKHDAETCRGLCKVIVYCVLTLCTSVKTYCCNIRTHTVWTMLNLQTAKLFSVQAPPYNPYQYLAYATFYALRQY